MLESLSSSSKGYGWIKTLKDNVLEVPYFSECSFLLMEKAEEDRVPKEHLGKYFCQFYLSKPYSDLINDGRTVSVFSKQKLEKHHIVPLGSVTRIGESTDRLRADKTNIVNSPLNYVYITDTTNGEISDKSLKDYEDSITASAKAALNIINYPAVADLTDEAKVRKWLVERHMVIKGALQNRVTNLLLT